MRKQLFFSIIFISLGLLFNNCSKNPVYPVIPEIIFEKYEKFIDQDILKITLSFKDGDGDLGLDQNLMSYPYQLHNIIKDGTGNYILYRSDPSLPPYACKNYAVGDYVGNSAIDTVLADFNIYYNNYHLEIYEKQLNGSYVKIDDSDQCNINRFPPLVPVQDKGPIEGMLSYDVYDHFGLFFGKTLKFKIFIIDRALNKSNVIETPDIVMN
jgi:hypothetical protein